MKANIKTAFLSAAMLAAVSCGSPDTSPDSVNNEQAELATAEADDSAGKVWVTSQYLDRHTCPSESCGIVGRLSFREAAWVLERRGKWVRTTKTYDASCQSGRSQYVDKGNGACTADNGIVHGKFAEWVLASQLSPTRPADPAETASAAERLVAQSDDFTQHRAAFVKAADELMQQGRCTAADFEEQGGWMKSSNHRDEPVYFTYCGEMIIANRIYLNASSGKIFQE